MSVNGACSSTALKVFTETSNYMPPLPALRDFIQMYRLDAKKALSQNYLMDLNLTRKMVRKAGDLTDAFVLEVGPGPGGITRAILEQPCKRLDVVELDKQFLSPLKHLQSHAQGRMHIHHGDILKTDVHQIWQQAGAPKCDWMDEDPPFRILGNLPFHISTPLVIRFLKQIAAGQGPFQFGRIPMTFTFQLEVARRIIAPLDSDSRSRIGVTCQNWTEPKILFEVPGQCFTPSPEIDVCIVHFVPRVEPQVPTAFELSNKVIRTLFHFKRKYLEKGVKLLYPKEMARDLAHELLRHCRLDPIGHVPYLGMEDFADICLTYERQCREHPGLYLYDHRQRRPMAELAAEPEPFPPEYIKPVQALQQIDREGISLSQFDATFLDTQGTRRSRKKWTKRWNSSQEEEQEGEDEEKLMEDEEELVDDEEEGTTNGGGRTASEEQKEKEEKK